MANDRWSEIGLSRDEQRRQKRQAVLDVAVRLFNEHGYDRTSLDDIASELGVTKRTLYYYVESKEEILYQCNRQAIGFLDDAVARWKRRKEPALDGIRQLLTAYSELMATDLGACLVLTNDRVLGAEHRNEVRSGRRKIDRLLRNMIREGIREGTIADCDPKLVSAAMFGAMNWVPHWNRDHTAISPDDVADQYLELFIEGLRAPGNSKGNDREHAPG